MSEKKDKVNTEDKLNTVEETRENTYLYNDGMNVLKRDIVKSTNGIVYEIKEINNVAMIERIRFFTEKHEITFRPKKITRVSELNEVLGAYTEKRTESLYTPAEINALYPEIVELAKKTLKDNVFVVFAYTKMVVTKIDKPQETYYYIMDWQVKMLDNPEEQTKHQQRKQKTKI